MCDYKNSHSGHTDARRWCRGCCPPPEMLVRVTKVVEDGTDVLAISSITMNSEVPGYCRAINNVELIRQHDRYSIRFAGIHLWPQLYIDTMVFHFAHAYEAHLGRNSKGGTR